MSIIYTCLSVIYTCNRNLFVIIYRCMLYEYWILFFGHECCSLDVFCASVCLCVSVCLSVLGSFPGCSTLIFHSAEVCGPVGGSGPEVSAGNNRVRATGLRNDSPRVSSSVSLLPSFLLSASWLPLSFHPSSLLTP